MRLQLVVDSQADRAWADNVLLQRNGWKQFRGRYATRVANILDERGDADVVDLNGSSRIEQRVVTLIHACRWVEFGGSATDVALRQNDGRLQGNLQPLINQRTGDLPFRGTRQSRAFRNDGLPSPRHKGLGQLCVQVSQVSLQRQAANRSPRKRVLQAVVGSLACVHTETHSQCVEFANLYIAPIDIEDRGVEFQAPIEPGGAGTD